jgi:hypothetical protein
MAITVGSPKTQAEQSGLPPFFESWISVISVFFHLLDYDVMSVIMLELVDRHF